MSMFAHTVAETRAKVKQSSFLLDPSHAHYLLHGVPDHSSHQQHILFSEDLSIMNSDKAHTVADFQASHIKTLSTSVQFLRSVLKVARDINDKLHACNVPAVRRTQHRAHATSEQARRGAQSGCCEGRVVSEASG